jgi:ABC-type multidrug transport system ATPase subunit
LNAILFLEYLAAMKGLEGKSARERIGQLLQIVGLAEVRKRPLKGYSGGMKQRLGIAQALLNDPQLLIVDEPTSGLDPKERVHFRNLLADLAGERIVILSTHIISDLEAAATEIVILNHGYLQRHCSPEALLNTVEGKVWMWVIPSTELTDIRQNMLISSTVHRSDGVHVRLVADKPPSREARSITPNLEDAYLYCLSDSREEAVA